MDSTSINNQMKKSSIFFVAIYLVVWLTSSLIIYAFDYVHGLIIGAKIVDSWSMGMMFWFGLVFIIPAVYLLIMVYLLFKKYA